MGILFPNAPGFADGIAQHPSQIYAALAEGLIPFIYVQWRFWKSNIIKKCPGQLSEIFSSLCINKNSKRIIQRTRCIINYGDIKGQFYSIFLILGGV